jgi:hypothetical protein
MKLKLQFRWKCTKCSDLRMKLHTVPKAVSMHETFPKLPGKISKTTLKY